MKLRIEIDDTVSEEEIVIRCNSLNEETLSLQQRLSDVLQNRLQLNVYKNDKQCFVRVDEIIFLESANNIVAVHTKDAVYETKEKLYELEGLLGRSFMRVSKSVILNMNEVRAIRKNIAGPSEVEFKGSVKTVFASRKFINELFNRMEEKSLR